MSFLPSTLWLQGEVVVVGREKR